MSSQATVRVNKFARLWQRLQDPEWRKYGAVLLCGKLGAIAILMMVFALVSAFTGAPAHAADPSLKGNDIVSPLNVAARFSPPSRANTPDDAAQPTVRKSDFTVVNPRHNN